ncbi:DUF1559 family PulG-like putative transporter [Lignipirellula cremea]|uniref:DUF1559 domain-containing protein n=1 Tax=Lignipirellula cremea TaxID=2528010 RepID=A0A518DPX3_9BACT|nr:DUF1559 domain-containing protein [Lignipirellula cremea]QDU93890.1 hypothetical protein Pla8534_16750 [Lignipirellula cremea]
MVATGLASGFVALLMFVFSGSPLGLPPEPEREILARIAPEECLFYLTWSGAMEANPASQNATELLAAEPAVQKSFAQLEQALNLAIGNGEPLPPDSMPAVVQRVGRHVLTHAAAIYVRDVQLEQGPQIAAGAVFNLDENAAEFSTRLQDAVTGLFGDAVTEVQLQGKTFHTVQPGPGPPVTWGMIGNYLLVAVGEGEMKNLLDCALSPVPAWLAKIRQETTLERRASIAWIDVEKALKIVDSLPEGTINPALINASGARSIRSYVSVSGLDATGFQTRTLLEFNGEPEGLFAALDGPGLTAEDLALIPNAAPGAMALRVSPADLMDRLIAVAHQVDPSIAAKMTEDRAKLQQDLGAELNDMLGDVWRVYAAPHDGGIMSGWVLVGDVKDPAAVSAWLKKVAAGSPLVSNYGTLEGVDDSLQVNGHTLYRLRADTDLLVEPTWCVTDKHLVVGIYPHAVRGFLQQKPPTETLADDPQIAAALAAEGAMPFALRLDLREVFERLYPVLQFGGVVMEQEFLGRGRVAEEESPIDLMALPPGSAIAPHLTPAYTTIHRTETGLEFVSKQSLPGFSVGAVAPLVTAAIVPAGIEARLAAQRMNSQNNLKQIGLGVHNFADQNLRLPHSANTDADGKPLLSWRVHILPYMEMSSLYDQFHLDEPWDSEHNLAVAGKVTPVVYAAPGASLEPGKTVYLANVSKDGFLRPQNEGNLKFRDITDGMSNTIAIVEAAPENAVFWTKPDDFAYEAENRTKGLVGLRRGGFLAVYADGSVQLVDYTNPTLLYRLFTRNDGEFIDPNEFPNDDQ